MEEFKSKVIEVQKSIQEYIQNQKENEGQEYVISGITNETKAQNRQYLEVKEELNSLLKLKEQLTAPLKTAAKINEQDRSLLATKMQINILKKRLASEH